VTMLRRVAFSLFELPIAVGLGFAAFWGVFALGCAITHCVDVSGAGWMLLGMIAGPLLALVFWIAMWRVGPRFRRRLIWDAVALVVGVGAYAVPVILSEIETARSVAASRNRATDLERARPEAGPDKGTSAPNLRIERPR